MIIIEEWDEEKWEFVSPMRVPTLWVKQDQYVPGNLVSSFEDVYRCKLTHYPDTDEPPGSAFAWSVNWDLVEVFYHVNDVVSRSGKNYRCLVTHTPSGVNSPGDGTGSWGTYWEPQDVSANRFFVDSGKVFGRLGAISSLGGLSHLSNKTVQILANGYVLPSRTVSSGGVISFDQPNDPASFDSLVVGLPYESVLEPMALEAAMENGTSVAREKRIHEVVIYFHESGGCKVSRHKTGPYETLPFRTADMIADQAAPLFSGPYVHTLESRHDMDASFVMKQDLPLPMTILAVVPKWNIYGDQG